MTGGTLLVNNTAGSGTGTAAVTVSNAGTTLGGSGTISGPVTVNAGANMAPGNGGNNTAVFNTGALTLASASNFRVDINGTTVGSQLTNSGWPTGGVTITGSNLVVTVGTTLSLGQTFTILNKATRGSSPVHSRGSPGGTVAGSNVPFSRSVTSRRWRRRRAHGSERGPRTEHMDGRCAWDRWARFYAASQTEKVNRAQSIGLTKALSEFLSLLTAPPLRSRLRSPGSKAILAHQNGGPGFHHHA